MVYSTPPPSRIKKRNFKIRARPKRDGLKIQEGRDLRDLTDPSCTREAEWGKPRTGKSHEERNGVKSRGT